MKFLFFSKQIRKLNFYSEIINCMHLYEGISEMVNEHCGFLLYEFLATYWCIGKPHSKGTATSYNFDLFEHVSR